MIHELADDMFTQGVANVILESPTTRQISFQCRWADTELFTILKISDTSLV